LQQNEKGTASTIPIKRIHRKSIYIPNKSPFVVYQYTALQFLGITYGFSFVAHYGWTQYPEVNFSGALGSLYYFF